MPNLEWTDEHTRKLINFNSIWCIDGIKLEIRTYVLESTTIIKLPSIDAARLAAAIMPDEYKDVQ